MASTVRSSVRRASSDLQPATGRSSGRRTASPSVSLSGFLEPLESTSLYLIRQGISRFIALFPDASQPPIFRDEYNRWMQKDFEQVRDLLVLHYYANERDEPFWRHCRNMRIPETLQRRLALFSEGGRFLRNEGELFPNASWVAVMLGQNVIPRAVDPVICGRAGRRDRTETGIAAPGDERVRRHPAFA